MAEKKPMTNLQRELLNERRIELLHDKRVRLEEKFTTPAKRLDNKERFLLLATGKVKLQKNIQEIGEYDDVSDVFDFSPFESEKKFDAKGFEKAFVPIKTAATKIRDMTILGDVEGAVAALQALENS